MCSCNKGIILSLYLLSPKNNLINFKNRRQYYNISKFYSTEQLFNSEAFYIYQR